MAVLRLVTRRNDSWPEEEAITQHRSFGSLLRSLREAASLTQEELARLAGLSSKAISTLERGERMRPHPHTVRALVKALNLSEQNRISLLASLPKRTDSPQSSGTATQPSDITMDFSVGVMTVPRQAVRCESSDDLQRDAAWEIYVELITRVAVVELSSNQGMLREALASLHSLFASIRGILRQYGPALAYPPRPGLPALDGIATTLLNDGLRPVLSEWHPLLLHHESQRPPGLSLVEHERDWDRNQELRKALRVLQVTLGEYAETLAGIAGIPFPCTGGRIDANSTSIRAAGDR